MKNDQHIDKRIEDAINSFDGAGRALPKPFLFTRLTARMNNAKESSWEKAGRFIARPAVVIAGLCVVLTLNAMVLFTNSDKPATAEQTSTTDEFSTNIASLYNFENTEQ